MNLPICSINVSYQCDGYWRRTVKLLSKKAFDKASNFISTRGRPLEKAQFEFHFNNGSVEDVLLELGKFQNPDGGFGHAVEPDVRMPES